MSRNWLIGVGVGLVATAALVTVGVTGYELGERGTQQVVVTGTESVGRPIVVAQDGWRHGPGFGFLVVPLVIVGGILLLSSRRRRGWCGPGARSGPWGYGPGRDRTDRYWDERYGDERYGDERHGDGRYGTERDRGPDRPVDVPAAPTPPDPSP